VNATPLDRAALPPDPAQWLDAYLDGLLGEAERAEFESLLSREPALADAVALQRRIDAEIRVALAPPESASAPFAGPLAATVPITRPRATTVRAARPAPQPAKPSVLARLRPWALAAGLALASIGAYVVAQRQAAGEMKYVEPADLYARLKSNGFTPEFVCTTDAEFAGAVQARLGSPLALAPDGRTGVQLVGWAYGNTYEGRIVGPDTLVLMTRLDGTHDVLVLMDKAASDRRLTLPPGSGLSLFRRQVGSLVLYELTPLGKPRLLDVFVRP